MENEVVTAGGDFLTNIGGVAGIVAIVGMVLERVGKAIPDSATGLLGVIRSVSKLISAYVPNNDK